MAPSGRCRGFSLVEVVLATGIISFAVIAVIGLLGSLSHRASELTESREAMQAVGALRTYLNRELQYDGLSAALSGGGDVRLVFGTFRDGGSGGAVASVAGRWDLASADWSGGRSNQEGRYFYAILRRNDDLTPGVGTSALVLDVDLYSIPEPTTTPAAGIRPLISTPISVRR